MTDWTLQAGVTSRLVLVRHGEPEQSMRGRCYGRLDVSLSARGRAQMNAMRRELAAAPITAFYSSSLRRAVESANILASGRGSVTMCEDLREMDFGGFEGLTYCEIAERFPALYKRWMAAPTTVAFPGGELFDGMVRRVRAAIDNIRTAHPSRAVAVVSHAGVNRIALGSALGLEPGRLFAFDQSYACVNVIDYFGDTPVVRLVNAAPAVRC
jgi:alpha-ribazole phosphatase